MNLKSVASQMRDVIDRSRDQVVHGNHSMAPIEQQIHEMGAKNPLRP